MNHPPENPADASDRWSEYVSPLASRNASPAMQAIWSPRRKFGAWRCLWLALAEAEQELGLPITDEQIQSLRDHLDLTDVDFANAAAYEAKLRHDVMAHIHALGDVAPAARPIIHLGATSQFVNCNAEIMQMRDALELVCVKTASVIDALADFARTWRDMPCLAFTHYQPAQPTTVGKRAAMWAYDLSLCLERLERTRSDLRLRGAKGATGTQASFLSLFDGDAGKVEQLDRLVCEKLGFTPEQRYLLTGQTYPRVVDSFVISELASLAAAVHKMCNDIRLLSNRKELDEPFGDAQVGSSAMPYKRNPMRCERATGLCRFVMSMAQNPLNTAATQWLERTLDDSANRRLALPEPFLALDGALDIMHNVGAGLLVHEATVRANLMAELPFLASENVMMAAVKLGRDRQEIHEAIRRHSQAAGIRVKDRGEPSDLIERMRTEPLLKGIDLDAMLDPMAYVGLAPRQVDVFLEEIAGPIRERYGERLTSAPEPGV
ncbi:MAG: adenylosuccinate lyase [Phycisphaeraceae bacterium]|nr:MAG: adenylosuccinate lyase [Phycisphaeraceae bacterium]